MADLGEYNPRPSTWPSASRTRTSLPAAAGPITLAIPCANTHGCPAQSGRTWPGLRMTSVMALDRREARAWQVRSRLLACPAMMRARAFAMITAFGATAAGADADEPCPDGWFCEPADEASQPAEQPVEPPTRQQEQLPSEPPRFDEPPPPSVFDVRREESDEPLLERGLGVFGRLQWALVGEGVPLMGGGGGGL